MNLQRCVDRFEIQQIKSFSNKPDLNIVEIYLLSNEEEKRSEVGLLFFFFLPKMLLLVIVENSFKTRIPFYLLTFEYYSRGIEMNEHRNFYQYQTSFCFQC